MVGSERMQSCEDTFYWTEEVDIQAGLEYGNETRRCKGRRRVVQFIFCLSHIFSSSTAHCHNLRKNGDYILGVVFYPKPSSVSDVAGIQSVHASLN